MARTLSYKAPHPPPPSVPSWLEQLLTAQRMSCAHIYSALDQTARKINLAKFTHGKCSTLIVTDLAARGLDIPLLDNVINYSFPAKGKLFLHRVGKEPAGVLPVEKPRPRGLTCKSGSGAGGRPGSARQPHCSQEVALCFLVPKSWASLSFLPWYLMRWSHSPHSLKSSQ